MIFFNTFHCNGHLESILIMHMQIHSWHAVSTWSKHLYPIINVEFHIVELSEMVTS